MSTAITPKRGRPPKFREEFPELAMHLCRLGGTNKDLALALGVSTAAIDKWIANKPEFAEAVREGRELADARVASALYQRAVGAVVPDTHIATFEGKTIITPLLKHFPPDTAACSLWLRNRRPDLWREKTTQAVELTNGENPYHEVAMRIMAADDAVAKEIYDDEMAKIRAGCPTPIPDGAPDRIDSPLHAMVGLPSPPTEAGHREYAQMVASIHQEQGWELPSTSKRDAIEAEIVPNKPALPPSSHAERVSPESPAVTQETAPTPAPEAAAEGDDFRALLGLPPRED
jgi:hypothetical protein